MPFLDFEKDYATIFKHFENRREIPGDKTFLKWLKQNRTKITLQADTANHFQVTNPHEVKRLRKRRARRLLPLVESGTLKKFYASPSTMIELMSIQELFHASAEEAALHSPIFPAYDPQTLLRRNKEDLLLLFKQMKLRRQQRKGSIDFEIVAELPNGYVLGRIKTEREAIREGEEMRNCLKDLDLPPARRRYHMGEYINALFSGDLMSVRDAVGKSVATLRFKNGMLAEVRGFANGGLLRPVAMELREYFMTQKTPLDVNAAARLGLIYDNGKLKSYEDVLPRMLLTEKDIRIDGWPVEDADLGLLRNRHNLLLLSIINCPNITHLPETTGFQSGPRYGVYTQSRIVQQNPMSTEEANAWLAWNHPKKPTAEAPIYKRHLRAV